MSAEADQQVAAVRAVLAWLIEITRSPELDPIRRDGTQRFISLVSIALDSPAEALEHYRPGAVR